MTPEGRPRCPPAARVRRYQRIDRQAPVFEATRFDVFPGGCVTTRRALRGQPGRDHQPSWRLLGFIPRQALHQALEQRSGGRLQL